MRTDTANYRALFLSDTPLVDARSPVEFAQGSFPGAVNLPLMTDGERAAVGTCYKESGQAAAIALGHKLVHGDIKAARVAAWLEFAQRHPNGYLYCFRGGMRSQICQQWLHEAGCDYPRVVGGYKAMRQFLLQSLEQVSATHPLLVLGGRTGCAKTAWLPALPVAIDLEALANHRGSAFGRRVGGQPSQIDFENALAVALLRMDAAHADDALVVEDESKLIGRLLLPLPLQAAMKRSPRIVLEAPLDQRVEHTFRYYILGNLHDWQKELGEEAGFLEFADELRQSLSDIQRRLGGDRFRQVQDLLEKALQQHAGGDADLHREWITLLLRDYYDPMYDHQLRNHTDRIIFRGEADAVRDFIAQYKPVV